MKTSQGFMPYRDPYSSDDATVCNSEEDRVNMRRKDNNLVLARTQNTLNVSGTSLLYFFDLNFKPQVDQINLCELSVERIVEKVLGFTCSNLNVRQSDELKHNKMETCERHFHQCHWLKWMSENDVINFKSERNEAWIEKRNEFISFIDSQKCCENDSFELYKADKKYIKTVFEIISTVHDNYVDNHCSNKSRMKDIFRVIEQLMPLQTKLRLNANYSLTLIEPKKILIHNPKVLVAEAKPDGVYATRKKFTTSPHIGKIVVNVYDKDKVNSSSALEEVCINPTEVNNLITVSKPTRSAYDGLSKEYDKHAFMYLKKSLPTDCRENNLVHEMTGQHVLQLLCMAEEQKTNRKYWLTTQSDNYTAIGIFMKNEYVYFSTLEINHDTLNSLFSVIKCNAVSGDEMEKGLVSFSNWCLDLTLANHRIAFMIVMLELLSV